MKMGCPHCGRFFRVPQSLIAAQAERLVRFNPLPRLLGIGLSMGLIVALGIPMTMHMVAPERQELKVELSEITTRIADLESQLVRLRANRVQNDDVLQSRATQPSLPTENKSMETAERPEHSTSPSPQKMSEDSLD